MAATAPAIMPSHKHIQGRKEKEGVVSNIKCLSLLLGSKKPFRRFVFMSHWLELYPTDRETGQVGIWEKQMRLLG